MYPTASGDRHLSPQSFRQGGGNLEFIRHRCHRAVIMQPAFRQTMSEIVDLTEALGSDRGHDLALVILKSQPERLGRVGSSSFKSGPNIGLRKGKPFLTSSFSVSY